MKKQIDSKRVVLFTLFLFGMLVVSLTGCTSRPDPKEAVEAFINGEVYGKELDSYEKIFSMKVDKTTDYSQGFLEGFESSSGIKLKKEDAEKVANQLFERLKKDTSFKVTKVEEDKEKRHVTVSLKGLDFTKNLDSLQKIMEDEMFLVLNEKGFDVHSTEEIQNLEFDKAQEIVALSKDNDFLAEVSVKSLEKYLVKVPVKEDPSIVVIQLVPSKENRNTWTVSDREQVSKRIMTTLLGGQ